LTEVGPYLRGQFPKCPVSSEDNEVRVEASAVGFGGEASPAKSWAYCTANGQFIVNSDKATNNENDDPALTYDQL
jgi:hypothetical protein